jgi:arginine deiminase
MLKKTLLFYIFLLLSTLTFGVNKDHLPSAEAEWHDAKVVMVHFPGVESFFISMFPVASGYEKTFNQVEARKEFKLLKDTLEHFGVQVNTTEDIFLSNVQDTNGQVIESQQLFALQHFAKHFLKIDLSNLKIPLPFDLITYKNHIISAIDPENLIKLIFLNPTVHLYQESEYLVANNTLLPKFSITPISNFFYMNDLGITTSKGITIGKLSNPQRQDEVKIFKYLLSAESIEPIYEVTGHGRLEGGDFIPADSVCFIGQGLRTNSTAIKQLLENNVFDSKEVVVVKDNLKQPHQMHLTKYFNFLNKNTVVFAENRMEGDNETKADVYEYSTDQERYRLVRRNTPFVNYLKDQLQYTIIPVSLDDQQKLAMDYFLVKPDTIIASDGVSSDYKDLLREKGVNAVWLNIENIKAGHGGIRSVIQVLKRKFQKPVKTLKNISTANSSDYINL